MVASDLFNEHRLAGVLLLLSFISFAIGATLPVVGEKGNAGIFALAAYGGSLLQVGLLPAWAGWATAIFSIAMLILLLITGDTLPAFHYFPALLIGVLLVLRG